MELLSRDSRLQDSGNRTRDLADACLEPADGMMDDLSVDAALDLAQTESK